MFKLYWVLLQKLVQFLQSQKVKFEKRGEAKREKEQLLARIERHLTRLHLDARLSGLADFELAKIVVPSLHGGLSEQKSNSRQTKGRFRFCILLAAFLLVLSYWNYCTTCHRVSYRIGRRILFRLEPYWNWPEVYYSRCLIASGQEWQQASEAARPPPCDFCDAWHQVPTLPWSGSDHDQITFHIRHGMPVKLVPPDTRHQEAAAVRMKKEVAEEEVDVPRGWPIATLRSLSHFHTYFTNNTLTHQRICIYQSSLADTSHPAQFFAELAALRNNRSWFVHWENCGLDARKQWRKEYRRPSWLPPMVELSQPNWLLVSSSGGHQRSLKPISPLAGTDVLIFIQIHGHIELSVSPRHGCWSEGCSDLDSFTLGPDEIAITGPRHWLARYRPSESGNTNTNSDDKDKDGQDNNKNTNTTINLTLVLAGLHA